MLYYFILGTNPTLSIAEIVSLQKIHQGKIEKISEEVLFLETKRKINCQKLQEKLGGTVKIGKIFKRVINLKEIKADIFLENLKFNNQKIFFGFSIYKIEKKSKLNFSKKLKEIALDIKRKLKEKGFSSRWVISKKRVLSSVIVKKNKLLTQGAEFCFFIEKDEMYIGKTESCQEFEEYEFYDFARPYRPIEKGLLPPKLAKIMINLSQVSENKIILDPFCGSGTILQQAILLGYNNIIGSDKDETMVKKAEKNINWLINRLKIKNKNVKIFSSDVKEISKRITAKSIDTIVTEPYLGPIKIKFNKLPLIIDQLTNLYINAFKEFKKILKPNGKVVIIFPVFRFFKKVIFLSRQLFPKIEREGWKIKEPLPKSFKKESFINLTSRNSIIYSRPNQKVLREIFILLKS